MTEHDVHRDAYVWEQRAKILLQHVAQTAGHDIANGFEDGTGWVGEALVGQPCLPVALPLLVAAPQAMWDRSEPPGYAVRSFAEHVSGPVTRERWIPAPPQHEAAPCLEGWNKGDPPGWRVACEGDGSWHWYCFIEVQGECAVDEQADARAQAACWTTAINHARAVLAAAPPHGGPADVTEAHARAASDARDTWAGRPSVWDRLEWQDRDGWRAVARAVLAVATPAAPKGPDIDPLTAPLEQVEAYLRAEGFDPEAIHRKGDAIGRVLRGETPDDRERAIVRRLAGEWGEIEVGPTNSIDDVVSHIHGAGTVIMRLINEVGDWSYWARRILGSKEHRDAKLREGIEAKLAAAPSVVASREIEMACDAAISLGERRAWIGTDVVCGYCQAFCPEGGTIEHHAGCGVGSAKRLRAKLKAAPSAEPSTCYASTADDGSLLVNVDEAARAAVAIAKPATSNDARTGDASCSPSGWDEVIAARDAMLTAPGICEDDASRCVAPVTGSTKLRINDRVEATVVGSVEEIGEGEEEGEVLVMFDPEKPGLWLPVVDVRPAGGHVSPSEGGSWKQCVTCPAWVLALGTDGRCAYCVARSTGGPST